MLNPNTFYHIYNHANGSENLFREDKNYAYFLQLFQKHISPIADTYAYCLMPNHFHFLLKIKEVAVFQTFLKLRTFPKFGTLEKFKSLEKLNKHETLEKFDTPESYLNLQRFISKQFANCFSAYTQGFNKVYGRKGSLFLKNFKSKEVETDLYFTRLTNYIHFNPVAHGFTKDVKEWQYSSYHAFMENSNNNNVKEYTFKAFGGFTAFLNAHKKAINLADAFD